MTSNSQLYFCQQRTSLSLPVSIHHPVGIALVEHRRWLGWDWGFNSFEQLCKFKHLGLTNTIILKFARSHPSEGSSSRMIRLARKLPGSPTTLSKGLMLTSLNHSFLPISTFSLTQLVETLSSQSRARGLSGTLFFLKKCEKEMWPGFLCPFNVCIATGNFNKWGRSHNRLGPYCWVKTSNKVKTSDEIECASAPLVEVVIVVVVSSSKKSVSSLHKSE